MSSRIVVVEFHRVHRTHTGVKITQRPSKSAECPCSRLQMARILFGHSREDWLPSINLLCHLLLIQWTTFFSLTVPFTWFHLILCNTGPFQPPAIPSICKILKLCPFGILSLQSTNCWEPLLLHVLHDENKLLLSCRSWSTVSTLMDCAWPVRPVFQCVVYMDHMVNVLWRFSTIYYFECTWHLHRTVLLLQCIPNNIASMWTYEHKVVKKLFIITERKHSSYVHVLQRLLEVKPRNARNVSLKIYKA